MLKLFAKRPDPIPPRLCEAGTLDELSDDEIAAIEEDLYGPRFVLSDKLKDKTRATIASLPHAELMEMRLLAKIDLAMFYGLARGWDVPETLLRHLPPLAVQRIASFRLPNNAASGQFLDEIVCERLDAIEAEARERNGTGQAGAGGEAFIVVVPTPPAPGPAPSPGASPGLGYASPTPTPFMMPTFG